jgi:hypothetical protein
VQAGRNGDAARAASRPQQQRLADLDAAQPAHRNRGRANGQQAAGNPERVRAQASQPEVPEHGDVADHRDQHVSGQGDCPAGEKPLRYRQCREIVDDLPHRARRREVGVGSVRDLDDSSVQHAEHDQAGQRQRGKPQPAEPQPDDLGR